MSEHEAATVHANFAEMFDFFFTTQVMTSCNVFAYMQ